MRASQRFPEQFQDILPEPSGGGEAEIPNTESASLVERARRLFRSTLNSFGVYRVYSHEPPSPLSASATSPTLAQNLADASTASTTPFWPYPNLSSFLFGRWFWGHENKSKEDRDRLLKDVLFHPNFVLEDIRNVNFNKIDAKLPALSGEDDPLKHLPDGWTKTPIEIDVPLINASPKPFVVESLHHRSLLEVIRDVFEQEPSAERFCYQPYKEYWKRPSTSAADEQLYGELYTSDAFNKAHDDLQEMPGPKDYPHAIAALMFWSDSTHLTSFGQAKLWPLYLFFGNQSKYERSQPSQRAAQHVAYFPSVSLNHFLCTTNNARLAS